MTDRLYFRISLDTKVSGSIEKQRATLAAKASPGFVEYEDRSTSASKVRFAEREAGRRLLADLEPGDRVLVTKIDRAARDLEDLLSLVRIAEERGASIEFTEAEFPTTGPAGRLMLQVVGAIAEFEAALIAERRRESLAAFRAEGRHAVGAAPFGLRSVPNPKGRGLVLRPDPETAPVLREVVERVQGGEPQAALAPLVGLKEAGLSRLLRNERLAGVLGYDESGAPRIDEEQAVFSLAKWRALQAFLAKPERKTWARTEGIGPALQCSECGGRLYVSRAKAPRKDTYKCLRRGRHAKGEPSASVTVEAADAHVQETFLRLFDGFEVVERLTVSGSDERDEAIAVARTRIDRAKEALADAESDDEEDGAFQALRAAKRALRDAEALPDETVVRDVPTGEHYAEVWARSGDAERVEILRRVGRWIVSPGRLPIAVKVRFERLDDEFPDYLAGQTD